MVLLRSHCSEIQNSVNIEVELEEKILGHSFGFWNSVEIGKWDGA